MSKAKKLMTKTNRSQAGIINMVSNISNVVGYSNVMPFLEHDAGNMTSSANSITKRNKDTCSRKHCSIIDGNNILTESNIVGEESNNNNKNNNKNNKNNDKNNKNDNNDEDEDDDDNNDDDDDDDDDNGDVDDVADAYVDAETDSLASMETLSDNVAIWVDGERHWISGVDANTTCMDLICALLNYQNGQQMFNHDADHGQDNLNDYHDRNKGNNENPNNNCNIGGNNAINQSMPTKDGKQESVQTAVYQDVQHHGKQNISNTKATLLLKRNVTLASEYVIVKQHHHCVEYLDGNTKVFDVLPTKVEGVLNSGGVIGASSRKECELFLRRLVSATAMSIEGRASTISPQHAGNTQVASLLSTDKDSGMGSPVGSARSARFRRRKYKSATWFSQGNTLHPKATQRSSGFSAAAAATIASAGNNVDNIANERLMRIILAQDETIHRQLSLLREKERQILKIEEEKHRVRERELGKNYLLETYFKGLDEAACEPDEDGDNEIFIDEPYQRIPENIEATARTGISQHRSSRHNKKLSNFHQQFRHQQGPNRFENNSSSDAVKVNNFVAANAADSAAIAATTATAMATATATAAASDAFVDEVDNKREIELQIFWLEKVYALNKQLQREEETLLKLHAKIRKHQVRFAYQMKNDVLEQIDELDAKLALQCADICRIEDNLVTSDEQLKGKLSLMEKLNSELQEAQEVISPPIATDSCYGIKNCDRKSNVDVEIADLEIRSKKRKPIVELSKFVEPIITDKEAFTTKPSGNLNGQISFDGDDECIELQNMTAMTAEVSNEAVETIATAVVSPMTKLALTTSVMYSSMLNQQQQKQNLNELTQQQQQQQEQQEQEQKHKQHNYPISCVNQFEQSSTIATNMDMDVHAMATQAAALTDKNMLPQHASNAKIVKKPMYEALSLNQMSSAAVTCQHQLPGSISTAQIGSTTSPLQDGNSIDLSRLGTLV